MNDATVSLRLANYASSESPEDPNLNPDGSLDFFKQYIEFTGGTEVTALANRWSMIGALGAWLGRSMYIKFGGSCIYPNQYIMLLGGSGAKKSTAIKSAKKLLHGAGFQNFSAEKISKEKFLAELGKAQTIEGTGALNNFLDQQLFADVDTGEYREVWICADEFNDFFANNIFEFVSTLGVLWDYEGLYENKVKHGESVVIPNPTVNILSGNTPTTFAETFPPTAIGQGFFSRLLAIHIAPSGRRIARPPSPTEEETAEFIAKLIEIKNFHSGEIEITEEAWELLDDIYINWKPVQDLRFEAYGSRRHTHLLKLCLIHAAARLSPVIEPLDVRRANTILDHAEFYMPDAFGEFGTARNSGLTHKILTTLDSSAELLTTIDLWTRMQLEFAKLEEFQTHLTGMVQAGKLQMQGDKILPKKRILETPTNKWVDYRYLSSEERGE